MTTQPPKISYNLIVKGQPEAALRAIDSLYGALYREGDECVVVDTGSNAKDLAALKDGLTKFPAARLIERPDLSVEYAPRIMKIFGTSGKAMLEEYSNGGVRSTSGVLSFSEARTVALEASVNDLIMWIDSDDILVEAEAGKLRQVIDKVFASGEVKCLLLDYEYDFAADGTCTTILRRERVVDKRAYYWKGRCHETLIPRPGHKSKQGEAVYFENVRSVIRHTEARKAHRLSDIRNFVILHQELEDTAESPDPRTVFYMANAARGLDHFALSLRLYSQFDTLSGSPDDRFAAHYYRGAVYLDGRIRRPFDAYDAYLECMKIKPKDPRAYFGLQRACLALYRFEESLLWYERGLPLKIARENLFSYDPTHVNFFPHIMAAEAKKELGDDRGALECAMRARAARPGLKVAEDLVGEYQNYCRGEAFAKAVKTAFACCPDIAAGERAVRPLLREVAVVPKSLERLGLGKVEPPEGRELRPEIAFYCPDTGESWGPSSVERGIGGSEKMVILLAEALQRTGKVNVSVYADVPLGERGIHENEVAWYHWSQMDLERPRAALVVWRVVEKIKTLSVPAAQRVLWLHDVQQPERYTPEVLACADLVQVQSEFHAAPLRGVVPDDKLWVARNATALPEKLPDVPRNPKDILYCSSWDRGLMTAVRIFQEAQKQDPELRLFVTYGVSEFARRARATWNHGFIPDLGRDASLDLYERELSAALDRVGAVVLNRVGFRQMSALMLQCGVWLYPTRFPEISCMGAMEAQQHGMVPVATRFGALEETLLTSDHCLEPLPANLSPKQIEAAATTLLAATRVRSDAPFRTELARAARQRFDVAALAEEWLQKLGLAGEGA